MAYFFSIRVIPSRFRDRGTSNWSLDESLNFFFHFFLMKNGKDFCCPAKCRTYRHIPLCPAGNDHRCCNIGSLYCDTPYTPILYTARCKKLMIQDGCWWSPSSPLQTCKIDAIYGGIRTNMFKKEKKKKTSEPQGWTVPMAFETFLVLFTVIWCFLQLLRFVEQSTPPFPLFLLFLSSTPTQTHTFFPQYLYVQRKAFM